MYVSAETDTYTPWGSEAPIECMLVKEEGNASYSKLPFNGIDGYVYKKVVELVSFRNIRRKIYFNIKNKDRQKDDIKKFIFASRKHGPDCSSSLG